MMYVGFMKNFLLADSGVQMPVRLISASWAADSGEQMPVRLISASWAQQRLIPTF